ncbi:CBASS cGAMP-activated phospholipase [Rhizobium lentis]|uniref:Patatin-like phospholipase/acyl hydrolase n=1 Tax=Rhizobium lentis TaxID=1138194 RepID=A0A7W8XGP5_9HYPH|nr:CBASS cGAMP-activated phospholipase [Rhizobium lentis]MBB4575958.1 patatin-like phospholipase/acyl hydrolase [Rhizobium lentis]MBB5551979.1 patatin-like phospholipase/acyl hydrolase [Rhizobium lentis]MBB5562517.1 patatin-like phospholipase/acyl hydrolase [Rhizobium lentis]MBB5569936.1 patatin-like phospholipase/acyl hydrolase [Rhizobium lentis]
MAFRILSLSGGGYRGLYSVAILRHLEQQAGRPIGDCFDMIAGTSIGGIIAIGLALGKRADHIERVFLERGEKIFPRSESRALRLLSKLRTGPKYKNAELRSAIDDVIGRDALLGDARTRLLVPAVNMSKGQVQMFKTPHNSRLVQDKHLLAADVAMATSAAPTFFPMARIGNSNYVDGGLMANAPDLCAVHEAMQFCGQNIENVHVLSIGTTSMKFSLPNSIGRDLGALDWLKNDRLLSTVMTTQQQLVTFMIGHQLGDRYFRIDREPSTEQSSDLGLDIANENRRETLLALADASYQDIAASPRLIEFLDHRPEAPEFT